MTIYLAISRMSTLGMKAYETTAQMASQVEQQTQFENQILVDLETYSFWRKTKSYTATLATDYIKILDFTNVTSQFEGVSVTSGTLSNRPPAGAVDAKAGDVYLAADKNEVYVSTGDEWKRVEQKDKGIAKWNPARTYAKEEIAEYNGVLYRSAIATNKGNKPEPDTDGRWVAITLPRTSEKYVFNKTYEPGHRVRYQGLVYESLISTNSTPSTKSAEWQVLAESWNELGNYSAIASYRAQDLVAHKGNIYENLTSVNTGESPATDNINWKLKFGVEDYKEWSSTTKYPLGDIVFSEDSEQTGREYWISIDSEGFNEKPSIHSNKWEPMSLLGAAVPRWKPNLKYFAGNIINYRGVLYKNAYGVNNKDLPPEDDVLNWIRIENNNYVAWSESINVALGQKVYYNGEIYIKQGKIQSANDGTEKPGSKGQESTDWKKVAGTTGEIGRSIFWNKDSIYYENDVVYYNRMYWRRRVTVIPKDSIDIDAPNLQHTRWEYLQMFAQAYDSEAVYSKGDIVTVNNTQYINTTGYNSKTGLRPPSDKVNWQLYNAFDTSIRVFETISDAISFPFITPGSTVHILDTDTMWTFVGADKTPPLKLIDPVYSVIIKDWTDTLLWFAASLYTLNERLLWIQDDNTPPIEMFSFDGSWIEQFPLTPVPIVNATVTKHSREWRTPTLENNTTLGSIVNVSGIAWKLGEMENWDPKATCGDDDYEMPWQNRYSGNFKGDVKNPILTLSSNATDNLNIGKDLRVTKIVGTTQVYDSVATDYFGDTQTPRVNGFVEFPGGLNLAATRRTTTLNPKEVYMSFPDVAGKWKLSASSSRAVLDSETFSSANYTIPEVGIFKIADDASPTKKYVSEYYKDGTLYHGIARPIDSEQANGELGGNWIPALTDIDPTITITRADGTEDFYFYGLTGQFIKRCPENDSDRLGFVLPHVKGGHANTIVVKMFLNNTQIYELNYHMLEDTIREYDPDNDFLTTNFYEGMHYIDINNRAIHAYNPIAASGKKVGQGVLVDKVSVHFRNFLGDQNGDANWQKNNFGINSFVPILSTKDTKTHGDGSYISEQWMKAGPGKYALGEGELARGGGWEKIFEHRPYAAIFAPESGSKNLFMRS